MTRKDAKETKKVMKASGVHVENLAVFLCAYCGQFHLGKGTIKGKKGVPRSRHFGSGNPNQVDYKSERK